MSKSLPPLATNGFVGHAAGIDSTTCDSIPPALSRSVGRTAACEQRRQVRVSNVNSDPQSQAGAPRKGLRRRRCRNARNVVCKNSLYARKASRVPAYLITGTGKLAPAWRQGALAALGRAAGMRLRVPCPHGDRPGRAPKADWPSLLSDQEPLCRGGRRTPVFFVWLRLTKDHELVLLRYDTICGPQRQETGK
jgi:hypothetical protein